MYVYTRNSLFYSQIEFPVNGRKIGKLRLISQSPISYRISTSENKIASLQSKGRIYRFLWKREFRSRLFFPRK